MKQISNCNPKCKDIRHMVSQETSPNSYKTIYLLEWHKYFKCMTNWINYTLKHNFTNIKILTNSCKYLAYLWKIKHILYGGTIFILKLYRSF